MIDFEWYRSFISIYKHRSVSAAAKARILTQPAMSQHLAALEAKVGTPLFIRAPRKMIPTDKGIELYTKVVPLIENLESITLEMSHSSSSETLAPIIRLASPAEFFTKGILHKISPSDVQLVVHFGTPDVLVDKLQKDEVDLVITTNKIPITGIEYTKIEDEEFVLVAPFHSSLHTEEQLDIEAWLKLQKWLSYGLELPIIRRFWREHFGKRPEIKLNHIIPNLLAILEAIENDMGISILPTYLIEESLQAQKTKVLFPHLSVKNTIYIARKVDNVGNPIFQNFIKELRNRRV
ncbi:LysR family transcriptional regulator [Peribacillus muralis]|uniref:LysR family transcriptional regulator n=1 Tax=Peribacillus muralis TaxID=264697 RepID=UPI003672C891